MDSLDYLNTKQNPGIRELTLEKGLSFPSDAELVMLILGSGSHDTPVEKLAQKVLSTVNGSGRGDLVDNLRKIRGMGISKTLAVAAALELGRRRNTHLGAVINKPSEVVPYVQHYAMEQKEHLVCISLNGAHEIISIRLVSVGTTNRTLVHPREIFAEPIAEHASAVIVCHNHPFGSCFPSKADTASTEVLQEASDILGINFLDHIIVTKGDYFSYLEHGLL